MKRILMILLMLCVWCVCGANLKPPFRAEAMAFYFVHDGGPLKLELKVATDVGNKHNPSYLRKDGAFVGRIFDADEKLVEWDYRKVKAGTETALSHDFGKNAPAGIYQIRYSGANIVVTPSAFPEKKFGVTPLRCTANATAPGQFSDTWFYIPENASKLSVASIGGKPTVKNTKGEAVGDVKKIDLAAHCGEVWQFSIPMKPGKYECFGFDGTQVILCPDAETAKRIKGSVETASDGTLYPHKFQVKIHDWIQNAKKTNLKMETVDLRRFVPEMEKDPAARGLIGPWGLFTYLNDMIAKQNIDPASPAFGETKYADALAAAYAMDKPYNPYYLNPVLEKRFLIAELKKFLGMTENETWAQSSSNYSGGDALGVVKKYEIFHEAYRSLKDREAAELWYDAVRRTADRFSMFRVTCENQSSHWPFIYLNLYEAAGNEKYREMAKDYVCGMSREGGNPFMQTGYLQEAYGPDATYQGLGACYLSLCYRMSGDPVAKNTLRTIYDLFNHSVAPEPDGRIFGASNFSHRTMGSWVRRQYGGGLQMMKGELPEAAVWFSEPENQSIEKTFRPQECTHGAIYATSVISPYYSVFKYPSGLLKDAKLPVMQSDNFTKNFNNEFIAVRRPACYAFAYIGQTAPNWTAGQRPKKPEKYHYNNKWTQTQGLSMLWFPGFGSFVLAMNWSGDTAQSLRADLDNGECAYPDYWDFSGKFVNGKLLIKSGMFNLKDVAFDRIINFLDNGVSQKLIVNFRKDIRVKDLYEQIPFLMEGKTLKFEFLVNGKWQGEPGIANEIRINDSIFIRLSRPLLCDFGPECRYQNQKMGALRLHLGNEFKSGDRFLLTYSIEREK